MMVRPSADLRSEVLMSPQAKRSRRRGGRRGETRTGGSGPVRASSSRPGSRICRRRGCPGTGPRDRVRGSGRDCRSGWRRSAGARPRRSNLQEILTGFVEVAGLAVGQVAKNTLARHAENQQFDFAVTAILEHQAMAAGQLGGVYQLPTSSRVMAAALRSRRACRVSWR